MVDGGPVDLGERPPPGSNAGLRRPVSSSSARAILALATMSGVRRSWAMLSPTDFSWSSSRSISSSIRLTASRHLLDVVAFAFPTGRRE